MQGRGNFFFSGLFLYFFQKSKHLCKKNHAVEAAKSNRLSLRRVKIHLGRIRSKRCRSENWVFLHMLFLENEAQINKNNYATMLFMSQQVSLLKCSLILQNIKIGPKYHIRPFLHESLQLVLYLIKTRSQMRSDFKSFLKKWFCHPIIWDVSQSPQKAHAQPVNKKIK